MTTHERIVAALARHPDWPISRLAMSSNAKVEEVRAVKAGVPMTPKPENSSLVSLDKIIAHYDIKSAIIREVAALPKGQLIVEGELCLKAAGADRNRFRRCVENNAEEFKVLRVKLKLDDSSEGKFYWGHAADIAEAQRIRDL